MMTACQTGDHEIFMTINMRGAASVSRKVEIYLDEKLPVRHYTSMKLEIVARQLDSLGNPIRLKIYRALVRAGDDGLPCGHLQEKLGIAASTLSHHIHHLMTTGLVHQERQGTTLICRANYPAMQNLVGFLVNECCLDAACKTDGKAA